MPIPKAIGLTPEIEAILAGNLGYEFALTVAVSALEVLAETSVTPSTQAYASNNALLCRRALEMRKSSILAAHDLKVGR